VIYETPRDQEREHGAAMQVATRSGAVLVKAPALACWDYMAIRGGKLVAALEVKVRSHDMDTYPTYMVSAEKVVKLRNLRQLLGVPVLLVVSFNGRIATLDVKAEGEMGMGGRTDRQDPNDQEPCLFFPVAAFSWLPVASDPAKQAAG
jgi:hypothetical protein